MKEIKLFSILSFFSVFSFAQTTNQFPANGNVQIVNGYDLLFPGVNGFNNSNILFDYGKPFSTANYERKLELNGVGNAFMTNMRHLSQPNIDHGVRMNIFLELYRNDNNLTDQYNGGFSQVHHQGSWIAAPSSTYQDNVRSIGMLLSSKYSSTSDWTAGVGVALNNNENVKHLFLTHGPMHFNSKKGINILPSGYTGIGTLTPTTTLEITSLDISEAVKAPGYGDSGLRLTHLTSSNTPTTGAAPIGVDATGKVVRVAGGASSSDAWLLNGNLGTTPAISDLAGNITSGNFLGTTDLKPLVIATNNRERLRVTTFGRLIFHNSDTTPNNTNNLYLGGGNDPVNLYPAGQNVINTVVGLGSFKANTSGYKNTVVGGNSFYNNTTGHQNTVIGSNSMVASTTGLQNVVLGSNAMFANTSGHYNLALGNGTLNKNTTGQYNIQLGYYSAPSGITTGNSNIGIGVNAGKNLTTGTNNIIIGSEVNASLPVNAPISGIASNQLNIGNWIFGHNGQIAIGSFTSTLSTVFTNNADYQLIVKKGIKTEKVRVELSSANSWADYVFEKDYDLMSIGDLDKFIQNNKHLPNIPTASEVVRDGIDLGQMDAKLLEKIEELTLYSIDLHKENADLKEETKLLQQENQEQQILLEELLKRVEQLELNK